MAHNTNIPWHLVVKHLRPSLGLDNHKLDELGEEGSEYEEPKYSDLVYRNLESQKQDLQDFCHSFSQQIHKAADAERAKYPTEYETPSTDEIVIPDQLAQKITPTVKQWRRLRFQESYDVNPLYVSPPNGGPTI